MIKDIFKTGETILWDDDGYRYRIFVDPESGCQIVYEEEHSSNMVEVARIGLPFASSVDAMIKALTHVKSVMEPDK